MLSKRIVPCLDVDLGREEGRVVKGVEFKDLREAGDPVDMAKWYNDEGADELVFLDITASHEGRMTMRDVVERTADEVFIPFTVGGGISSVEDVKGTLRAGADKTAINTAAVRDPSLLNEASGVFGSQCVVCAIDAKRRDPDERRENLDEEPIVVETEEGPKWYEVVIYGGRRPVGRDALRWTREAAERGAGELLVTSMDRDGTKVGYDLPLLSWIAENVPVPLIASGGAGKPRHLLDAFEAGADAALAASIFHYEEYGVPEVKEFLAGEGVEVRL